MRYVASYLLAALGGNTSPSAKDIKKILDSVGIEADDDRLNKVISELNGKNIEDVIAQGEAASRLWFSRSILIPAGQPGACQVSLVDQSTLEALTQRSEQGLVAHAWALLDTLQRGARSHWAPVNKLPHSPWVGGVGRWGVPGVITGPCLLPGMWFIGTSGWSWWGAVPVLDT